MLQLMNPESQSLASDTAVSEAGLCHKIQGLGANRGCIHGASALNHFTGTRSAEVLFAT
jgi:hypothetical protein